LYSQNLLFTLESGYIYLRSFPAKLRVLTFRPEGITGLEESGEGVEGFGTRKKRPYKETWMFWKEPSFILRG
jgi:hypothetical protein